MIWHDSSISECPSCGKTAIVGIMSLAKTCDCGFYYVDINEGRGWYSSREAYERGEASL